MQEQATFRRVDGPESCTLLVSGEIDLGVAGTFATALRDLLDDGAAPREIDLTGVTFFDSTGVGVLCDAAEVARRQGVALVVRPSENVRRTLELTGLAETFDLR